MVRLKDILTEYEAKRVMIVSESGILEKEITKLTTGDLHKFSGIDCRVVNANGGKIPHDTTMVSLYWDELTYRCVDKGLDIYN